VAGSPPDPYQLSADAVQAPPATIAGALRRIGPGLILAGSIVGTGELIATTNTGAKAGFTLLWLVLVSCFIKVFVQIELGRHTVSSGHTTLMAFRSLPGPGVLLVWWWLVMMLVTQTQMGAMVGGIGQAFHMAVPGAADRLAALLGGDSTGAGRWLAAHPETPWAALVAVATSAFLALGSYRTVEVGTTALVVAFTFITVGCVALLPAAGGTLAWSDIASGLQFKLPEVEGATVVAFAMFGITGVGASELVSYPYWCIEKGYARNVGPRDGSQAWVERGRGWMRVMFADAWVSMLVYTVATLAFYLLGAAVLHSHTDAKGLPGNVRGMLDTLSAMYEPVLGRTASRWFIVVGAFAVLYSTLFAATAANCRTLADFLRVNRLVTFHTPQRRTRLVRAFCVVFPLADFCLYLAMGNPPYMVQVGGFIQAVTLPMLATAAVFLRYRRTDRSLASGPVWDVLLWLSMLGLFATAAYGVWDSVLK
jgi:Mn2+/Fe2+ NRAMP family transporter